MREPAEWKQNDLQSFIDTGAEEGSQLEFKSVGALKKTDREKTEISKDISSFANSAGGVIIYGMDEERMPHTKPELLAQSTLENFRKNGWNK